MAVGIRQMAFQVRMRRHNELNEAKTNDYRKNITQKKKPTSFCCFRMELEITWEHRRGNSEASQIFSKGKEIIWSTGNYIH